MYVNKGTCMETKYTRFCLCMYIMTRPENNSVLTMADGQPFKLVKVHKPQKAHLHHLRDLCGQYQKNPPWVSEICTGNKSRTDGRAYNVQLDI